LQTDLGIIAALAEEKEEEHYAFRIFIKGIDGQKIDESVQRLNAAISAQIDCTSCGNCCKSLMVSIKPEERPYFGRHFWLEQDQAELQYLATGASGDTIMANMPCVFLEGNKCSIYASRFTDCREFPHLHKDGFSSRLFSVISSYGRCPIVFNVLEALKLELGFNSSEI